MRLKRGPLPVDEALEVCKQIAEALEAAHEKGIIHRDLKPSNVILSTNGEVFIIDCERSKEKNIHVSRIIGHEPYLAPETQKNGEYSTASDIYAMGMILKSLLASQEETKIQRYEQIITMCMMESPEERPSLSKIIRLLPSQSEAIQPWAKANIPRLCAERKEYFSSHLLPQNTTGVQKPSITISVVWASIGLICLLCAIIYALQEERQSQGHPEVKTVPTQAREPIEPEDAFQLEESIPKDVLKVQLRTKKSPPKNKKNSNKNKTCLTINCNK